MNDIVQFEKKEITQKDMAELKEQIIMSFSDTHDVELAYELNRVDEETAEVLEQDAEFLGRLSYIEAQFKRRILQTLEGLLSSKSEKMQYNAALALGKLVYPEKFGKEGNGSIDVSNHAINIYLPDNKR